MQWTGPKRSHTHSQSKRKKSTKSRKAEAEHGASEHTTKNQHTTGTIEIVGAAELPVSETDAESEGEVPPGVKGVVAVSDEIDGGGDDVPAGDDESCCRPQIPKPGWHPTPQCSVSLPHHPYWLQHSPRSQP
jgi:hypothetical protein